MRKIIGFDCRLNIQHQSKSVYERKELLWSDSVHQVLSVDTDVWPSQFDDYFLQSQRENPVPGMHGINGCPWVDYKKMLKFYSEESNFSCRISVSVITRDLMPVQFQFVENGGNFEGLNFRLIGYDVANIDLISGISSCWLSGLELRCVRRKFGAMINSFGLIEGEGFAIEISKYLNKIIKEHSPFYVFEILELN